MIIALQHSYKGSVRNICWVQIERHISDTMMAALDES